MWNWCTTRFLDVRVVVFNFAETRGGQHARDFQQLGTDVSWRGRDMGATEGGRVTHARRTVHELSST